MRFKNKEKLMRKNRFSTYNELRTLVDGIVEDIKLLNEQGHLLNILDDRDLVWEKIYYSEQLLTRMRAFLAVRK